MSIETDLEAEGYGYCFKYDALYDLKTYEWIEEPCGCEVCEHRPPRYPFMKVVVNNDKPKWKRS